MAAQAKQWLTLAGFALATLAPLAATADQIPPGLDAEVRCVVEGTAVVCPVRAQPSIQSHMTYARADVVQVPPFLKVLVGSVEYSDSRDKKPKLVLAFRAQKPGAGDLIVKVQGMVCADDGSSCPAVIKVVTTHIEVR
jgi:hypothetical protein